MAVAESKPGSLIDQLRDIVGDAQLLTDDYSCSLYAQDVYTKEKPALAVARPANIDQLSATVAAVTATGHAVIPRGGGMSYTSGFVPKEAGSVVVDMQAMNQVLEINAEDMYVTVQCGCTWKDLHEALDGSGLRTTYWGTLSGIHATVGGGLSQNSIFWGSARYGTAVDAAIGMEVVLADGRVISTGAGAQVNGTPFTRHYGPDLTGLFSSDAGALGFKAHATLRLIPVREHREHLSFDFDAYEPLVKAMTTIARADLVDECFAFDPYLQAVRMERESLLSDVKKLAGVMKAGGSVLGALKAGAKVAAAGRGFMKDVRYSLHVMIEERVAAAASAAADEVRSICGEHGAREIENSIPKILRANPFTPLNNMVGPNGERWVPIHTVVPHSKATATLDGIKKIFADNEADLEKHGIGVGYLLATVSTNGFVVEPVFFTPDALNELHKATVEDSALKSMRGFEANPAAAATTARLRKELIQLFSELGGVHMQIGKSYPYRTGIQPATFGVVDDIKSVLDPERRVNPGALGLD